MITIKEMANLLGVSTTTVSNVIHKKTNQVSHETIEKVEQLVKKHNYIPNMSARALAQNHSKIIGIILRYPIVKDRYATQTPFHGEIIGSIEVNVRNIDYYTMLYCAEDIDSIIDFKDKWNVDGLIVLCLGEQECQRIRQSTTKPIVFVDCSFYDDGNDYVHVGLEDEQAAYQMTMYLIEEGHRNIGFFPGYHNGVDKEREKGYLKALNESNIDLSHMQDITLGFTQDELETGLDRIYESINDYSALFFSTDFFATCAINYLTDRGISIPGDISVVGFDDNIFAQMVRPKLTTIKQDPSLKGKIAVDQLRKLIEGKELEERRIYLKAQLKIRDTVTNIKVNK